MNKEVQQQAWNQYQETTRHSGSTMKLDRILKRRMRAFIRARQVNISEGNKR